MRETYRCGEYVAAGGWIKMPPSKAFSTMLERTLGLSAPELIGGYFDDAEAVSVISRAGHGFSPLFSAMATI